MAEDEGRGVEANEDVPADRRLVSRIAVATVSGYQAAPPAQRALFGMSCSFAVTIAAARAVTYVQERNRPLPAVRGLGRKLRKAPGSNDVRVHHFLPGMALAFAAGAAAMVGGAGALEPWLSAPFGVGVALVSDELRLLVGRNNPYWGEQRFVFVQCGVATVAALGQCGAFARRGWTATGRRAGQHRTALT
jgi:hypothetical protein